VKAVVFGATRGIGRAVARRLAERGARIFLLGRDPEALARSASDLEAYGATGDVGFSRCDLADPERFEAALDAAREALDGFDTVVVTAGRFASQEELEADAQLRHELLEANFVGTVHFCEAVRARLLEAGGGTLCVFSSVAGERARKPVAIYGASKAGLSHYLEGLDHRYRGAGLVTVTVKPGFVKTGMTAGLDPPPFSTEPDTVARIAVRAIERGTPVVYAPPIWRLVMLVIRNLPRLLMRRLGF
jgi:short-subunit dehydrogenase